MNDVLSKILKAKEARAEARKKIACDGKSSLSLNLNVPGYPKSNSKLHQFFQQALSDLKMHLIAHRIHLDTANVIDCTDEAGDFFLAAIIDAQYSVEKIKEITEQFESNHPLGRLLDVDLTDSNGLPISSGKTKTCFYCKEKPAWECMRKQTHDYSDIRMKIDEEIDIFLKQVKKDEVCNRLSSTALRALLYEVSLTPKPGLVDRFSSGSHSDMDYISFLDSAAAISVYFKDIASFGYDFSAPEIKDALPDLRRIGLKMEKDMFAHTAGVNTHKGAIFLFGFSIFICAYLIAREDFSYHGFIDMVKTLNGNLVEKELGRKLYKTQKTHGEICFEKYGNLGKGIRGEIQAGLPCVFNHAIPVLEKYLNQVDTNKDSSLNQAMSLALLALMAKNNDSNILFRKGMECLMQVQKLAKKTFDSFGSPDYMNLYEDLRNYCSEQNISPGGSADLLAIAYFIYDSNRYWNKN